MNQTKGQISHIGKTLKFSSDKIEMLSDKGKVSFNTVENNSWELEAEIFNRGRYWLWILKSWKFKVKTFQVKSLKFFSICQHLCSVITFHIWCQTNDYFIARYRQSGTWKVLFIFLTF